MFASAPRLSRLGSVSIRFRRPRASSKSQRAALTAGLPDIHMARRAKKSTFPPLWTPQLPKFEGRVELGFRDLIELRFVDAFIKAGLGLKAIRRCLEYARECANDDRPFSTQRFKTDGRTIFRESLNQLGEAELLDLKRRQYFSKRLSNAISRIWRLRRTRLRAGGPSMARKRLSSIRLGLSDSLSQRISAFRPSRSPTR